MKEVLSVHFFESPDAFCEQAQSHWEADETRNNLILGVSLRLKEDLHAFGAAKPLMAVVKNAEGQIRASALMTPPFAMIVHSEPLNTAALDALAESLIANSWQLPGVNGVAEVSDSFAALWQEKTGQQARNIVNMRAYELRRVVEVDYPSGQMKVAEEGDAAVAADMLNAMSGEVAVGPTRLHTAQSTLESICQNRVFFWVDSGEVVSIALGNRPLISGICIGGVYTPPAHRGKGYARALVAEVSKEFLSRGYELTNLFTDLSNPTSNKIYQEVGYQPVCDYHLYEVVNFI